MKEDTCDKFELAMLKEEYFSALDGSKRNPFRKRRLHLAEEALSDFAAKMFKDDLKNKMIFQQCRLYARNKLVRLILRLSTT